MKNTVFLFLLVSWGEFCFASWADMARKGVSPTSVSSFTGAGAGAEGGAGAGAEGAGAEGGGGSRAEDEEHILWSKFREALQECDQYPKPSLIKRLEASYKLVDQTSTKITKYQFFAIALYQHKSFWQVTLNDLWRNMYRCKGDFRRLEPRLKKLVVATNKLYSHVSKELSKLSEGLADICVYRWECSERSETELSHIPFSSWTTNKGFNYFYEEEDRSFYKATARAGTYFIFHSIGPLRRGVCGDIQLDESEVIVMGDVFSKEPVRWLKNCKSKK
jgi:hypothetical protein